MHTCLPQIYLLLLLLLCSFIIHSQSVHNKIAGNTRQRIPREQPTHTQLRSKIKDVGRARTQVAIIDDVLAKTDDVSLRNDLSSRVPDLEGKPVEGIARVEEITSLTTAKPLTTGEYCPYNITKLNEAHDKWDHYRLGDALKGWFFHKHKCSEYYCPKVTSREMLLKDYEKFGNTIVTEYYTLTDSIKLNTNILWKIVKQKLQPMPEHTAVVHLRLGDTTCVECWEKPTLFKSSAENSMKSYAYSRTYYEQIIQKLVAEDVSTIIITASTYHSFKNQAVIYKNSMKYVKLVNDLFTKHGYRVMERINCGTPDEDFIFMSSAMYFVPGGGGFSQIIAQVAKEHGARVFTATDKPV